MDHCHLALMVFLIFVFFILCFCCSACFGTYVPTRVKIGLSGCWLAVVDGISGWVGWMTATASCAPGWLDTEGPDVDVVGTNGCGEGGSGAVGLSTCYGLGGGGDGIGEWSGLIGLAEIWLGDGSWICGGESS